MQLQNSITTVLSLVASVVAHPATTSSRATCDITTNLSCQLSASLWTAGTSTSTSNTTALCTSGALDMTWPGVLSGCAKCVEQSTSLTPGTLQTAVNTILFGDMPSGGNVSGACNTAADNTMMGALVAAGANLTEVYTLPVWFFNITST